jgi:hypothetical protein
VPWEKVPFVPRPSLVADPVTAFGKRASKFDGKRENILERINREGIKPKPESSLPPLTDYKSPRDLTREKVQREIAHMQRLRESGGVSSYMNDSQSIDVVLPRLHGVSQQTVREPHRRPYFQSNF